MNATADGVYSGVVDAQTGALIRRNNKVRFASAQVFKNYPGAEVGGTQTNVDLTPYLDPRDAEKRLASGKHPRLYGNFANVVFDPDNAVPNYKIPDAQAGEVPDVADVQGCPAGVAPPCHSQEVPPSDAVGNFNYPLTSFAVPTGNCQLAGCTWDYTKPFSWTTNAYQDAVQFFFLINNYLAHLYQPPIFFNEASGNYQVDNFNRGGKGGDPVFGRALAGADTDGAGLPSEEYRNNAFVLDHPDGDSPQIVSRLFAPIPEAKFSSSSPPNDAFIIYHELGHLAPRRDRLRPHYRRIPQQPSPPAPNKTPAPRQLPTHHHSHPQRQAGANASAYVGG